MDLLGDAQAALALLDQAAAGGFPVPLWTRNGADAQRNRDILIAYARGGVTQIELARFYQVTSERIRQIIGKERRYIELWCSRNRKFMARHGGDR